MDLEAQLSALGDDLSPYVPPRALDEFREFISVGEYGVGLETLCDRLSDAGTRLTAREVETIQRLAKEMALDYPGIDEVARLAHPRSR